MFAQRPRMQLLLLLSCLGLFLVLACTQVPPAEQKEPGPLASAEAEAGTPGLTPGAQGSPAASPVAQTSQDSAANVQEISLKFAPDTITVAPGTKVVWTNEDSVAHTVTSGQPGGSNTGQLFDQVTASKGDTFSYTFNQAGQFPYFCRYHLPGMVGTVVVQEGGAAVTAASPGPTNTPPPLPERFTTVGPSDILPGPVDATRVASGLQNPRGFTWGPDGSLYVAESGITDTVEVYGTDSPEQHVNVLFCDGWRQTSGEPPPAHCPQTEDPQYLLSGRISRVSPDGTRSTVVDNLPVIVGMFGFAEGPQSVAFIGQDLYVLIVHALGRQQTDGFATGVYQVNDDGSGTLIANLAEYNRDHPPKQVPPDFDYSEPHDMISLDRKLYVSDGNAGVIFEIDPSLPEDQRTRHIADLSDLGAGGGHPVLTGLSAGPDGNLYVTNLTKAPYPQGGANIWRVTVPDGEIEQVGSGLTLGVGLAVDPRMNFFVSEFAEVIPQAPFFQPGGRVVHTTVNGPVTRVDSSLMTLFFPTIIRLGPDGDLYVTYFSIGGEAGQDEGAIFRFDLPPVNQ